MIEKAFAMPDPYDFYAFSKKHPGVCGDKWHYAYTLGTAAVAMHVFPGFSPEQAYMLALWDMGCERAVANGQPLPTRPIFGIEAVDEPPPDPSFSDMAKSAGLGVVKWIASGSPVVSSADRDNRLALCKACQHINNSRCGLCGCFLTVKSWMTTERCPKGKW